MVRRGLRFESGSGLCKSAARRRLSVQIDLSPRGASLRPRAAQHTVKTEAASAAQLPSRRHSRARRRASVTTKLRTGTSANSARTASAQARNLFGRLLLAELFDERGDQLLQAQAVGGLVGADVLESRVDEFADSLLDLVADLAQALERLSGGIVDLPVLDLGGDEGAARLAAEGNCPVGVQLHLEVTFGQIAAAGSSPADSAQISAGA
jgi:hypothetical protein